jgi:hypothetical protein
MSIMERRPCQGVSLSVPMMVHLPLTYVAHVDTDKVLFKSVLAVILLAVLWPLGFIGYLLTVQLVHTILP